LPSSFNSTKPFSPRLAERLVIYAGASYCAGQKSVADWNCYACNMAPGFLHITSVHDPKTDGRGIVGYDPQLKARVVAFMGTNVNIKTWIDDLLIQKQAVYPDCHNCTVHSGFYNTWKGIKQQVVTAVQALPAGPLYVTGHSLGGALAALAATDFMQQHQDTKLHPDMVITVGQPRIGNAAWMKYYDSLKMTHYRVTHHRDPVPHLPYEWMDYSQVTQEVYYEDAQASSPTKICSDTNAEDPTCADQFDGNLLFIGDHWQYLKFSFLQGVVRCSL